jgi:phosphatidylglycerophosphate synthase
MRGEDFGRIDQPFFMRYLVRPMAWPLTAIAVKLGMTPNSMTAFRALSTAVGFALICAGSTSTYWLGLIIVLILGVVGTAVDGSLSRALNQASFFGKYFDGYMDAITEILLYLAIGIHLWAAGGTAEDILAGAVAAIMLSLVQAGGIRHHLMAGNLARAEADQAITLQRQQHSRLSAWLASPIGEALWEFFGNRGSLILWDVRYVGLILASALDGLGIYIVVMAIAQTILWLGFLPLRILRSYNELDVHRRSQTAT